MSSASNSELRSSEPSWLTLFGARRGWLAPGPVASVGPVKAEGQDGVDQDRQCDQHDDGCEVGHESSLLGGQAA